MSTEGEAATATTVEQRLNQLEDRVTELQKENKRLEAEKKQLRTRVDELEAEQESRAAVRWDSNTPADITLEAEYDYPLGQVLSAKAGRSEVESVEEDINELQDDVHDLKVDGVDAADLVGASGGDEPELPIEDTIAALQSDVRDDPSANKQRATVLFRAFGGRAHNTKGGKLQLDSTAARSILEEKAGLEDVNRNTLKRAMKQTAKLTSSEPKRERQARDENNLITLVKGKDGRLVLRADHGEWQSYLDEVSERYQ